MLPYCIFKSTAYLPGCNIFKGTASHQANKYSKLPHISTYSIQRYSISTKLTNIQSYRISARLKHIQRYRISTKLPHIHSCHKSTKLPHIQSYPISTKLPLIKSFHISTKLPHIKSYRISTQLPHIKSYQTTLSKLPHIQSYHISTKLPYIQSYHITPKGNTCPKPLSKGYADFKNGPPKNSPINKEQFLQSQNLNMTFFCSFEIVVIIFTCYSGHVWGPDTSTLPKSGEVRCRPTPALSDIYVFRVKYF